MGYLRLIRRPVAANTSASLASCALALLLLCGPETAVSQLVEALRYREVAPYRVDEMRLPNWEAAGRPGVFAADLVVPANSFLRSVTLTMADSPNPAGEFRLDLYRVLFRGDRHVFSHVAKLTGSGNPATAGAYPYRLPTGLALPGRYLLVASVAPGGGTFRWVVTSGASKRILFGLRNQTAAANGNTNGAANGAANGNTNGNTNGTTNGNVGDQSGSSSVSTGGSLVLIGAAGTGSFNSVDQSLGSGSGFLTITLGTPNTVYQPIRFRAPTPPPSENIGGNLLNFGSGGVVISGSNALTVGSIPPNSGTVNLSPPQPTPLDLVNASPVTSGGLTIGSVGSLPLTLTRATQSSGSITVGSPESSSPEEVEVSAFLSSAAEASEAPENSQFAQGPFLLFVDPASDGLLAFTTDHGRAEGLLGVGTPSPFSPVPVGSTGPTQRIRVRNLAEVSIGGLSIHASRETMRHFRINQAAQRTLASGETTEFRLTANPRRPGLLYGLIEIRTRAGSEFLSVSVRGVRPQITRLSPRAGLIDLR